MIDDPTADSSLPRCTIKGLRVLFIEPKYSFRDAEAWIPIGKSYLAAFLRKHGAEVAIVDNALDDLSDEALKDAILAFAPDVVGTGGMTIQWKDTLRIARLARSTTVGKALLLGGGVHLTVAPQEGLDVFDAVVIGEGEHTVLEICKAFQTGLPWDGIAGLMYRDPEGIPRRTFKRPYETNLQNFPFPALDILPVHRYHDFLITGERAISVMTGRGCPYDCNFCASPSLYERKVRTLPVKPVLDWMEVLAEQYECTNFRIMDDTFASSRKRVFEFCDEILRRGLMWNMTCLTHVNTADAEMFKAMKSAGFSIVALGIESGNDQVLKRINKGITVAQAANAVYLARRAGLAVEGLFMIGNIGDSKESILDTLEFARKHNPLFENGKRLGYNWFQFATPFPGSRFHQEAPHEGWISSLDYEDYTHQVPVFIPNGLDAKTMVELRTRGLREATPQMGAFSCFGLNAMEPRSKAVVFGAGKLGQSAVGILDRAFDVVAFVDNAVVKWGKDILGRVVYAPEALHQELSGLHIIIANQEHHREIAEQLHGLNLSDFGILLGTEQGDFEFYASEKELFHAMVLKDVAILAHDQKPVAFCVEGESFRPGTPRVFFITAFDFAGECGGPPGVIARLRTQNNFHHEIPNAVYIFGHHIMAPPEVDLGPRGLPANHVEISRALASDVECLGDRFLEDGISGVVLRRITWLEQVKERILQAHSHLNFGAEDLYVFHDVESAYLFKQLFDVKRTLLVYHNQGSMYYEYQAFGGEPDQSMERILFAMQQSVFRACCQIAFPARGAFEALLATESRLKEHAGEVEILHNGCDLHPKPSPSSLAQRVVASVMGSDAVFLTVAALNHAKAIERIPLFLSDAKTKGLSNLRWILIGNGALEPEVERSIAQNNLEDNVIWVKERVANEDIQFLMSKSDYYLILQRFAIFDFSTIEAMGHGCIPVLSNVFGNKECIVDKNGLLLDSFTDADPLIQLHESSKRPVLSELNRDIHARIFSGKAFLERYSAVVRKMSKR